MTAAVLVLPLLFPVPGPLGPAQQECRRWPDRKVTWAVLQHVNGQVAAIEAHLAIWPGRWHLYQDRLARLRCLRIRWDAVDTVAWHVQQSRGEEDCQQALDALRHLIGDEAFHGRLLPPLIP